MLKRALDHELIRAAHLLWQRAFDAWWREAERLAVDWEYRLAEHLIQRRAGRLMLRVLKYEPDEP